MDHDTFILFTGVNVNQLHERHAFLGQVPPDINYAELRTYMTDVYHINDRRYYIEGDNRLIYKMLHCQKYSNNISYTNTEGEVVPFDFFLT